MTPEIKKAGKNLFVVINGVRIAKRNFKLKTWVTIQPGWHVTDKTDNPSMGKYGVINIEHDGVLKFSLGNIWGPPRP